MVEVQKLSSCSLEEVTKLWNDGFSDYSVNIKSSVDDFIRRFALDSLSADYSYIAYSRGEPAGLLLNGFKNMSGILCSWNGGTVVLPQYRGKGIGKCLMDATMSLYREHGVQLASLEVLTTNQNAIDLYQKYGYESEQKLITLECTGLLTTSDKPVQHNKYQLQFGLPSDISTIDFYDNHAPWQSQWVNLTNSQSLTIRDQDGTIACYVLFKNTLNEPVTNKFIRLIQCVLNPNIQAADEIIEIALHEIFKPSITCRRFAGDFVTRDERVVHHLERLGFIPKSERYLMFKRFG